MNIVDINGLSEILKASKNTLKKRWREYPHFFIGMGEDLRGARFDVEEVITCLKERSRSNVGMVRQNKKILDFKVQLSKQATQKTRVQNQVTSSGLGSRNQDQAKTSGKPQDKFNLLAGIH